MKFGFNWPVVSEKNFEYIDGTPNMSGIQFG